jgi:hypothetical protein
MSRSLVTVVALVLLLAVSCAWADVTITSPTAGSTVGPATNVTGMCSQRAFLVIYSDVMNGDQLIGSVPGIRHWTNDNNSYAVKISTPRLFLRAGETPEPLTYVIHVKAYSNPPSDAAATPDVGDASVTVNSQ